MARQDRGQDGDITLQHKAIEQAIRTRLGERAPGKTLCPSEVARDLSAASDWRNRMEDVRRVAADMVARGELVVTQRGRPVDPLAASGPIRLGRPDPAADRGPRES